MVSDLVGEDSAGRHVVAVAEASREDQDVVLIEQPRGLDHPVDMDPVRLGARQLQCILGLRVTIRPCRSDYYGSNLCHRRSSHDLRSTIYNLPIVPGAC